MEEASKIIKEALNLQNESKDELVDKNDKLLKSFKVNNHEEEYQEHVNKLFKEFKYTTCLFNKGTVVFNGRFINGTVTMISKKGINLEVGNRTQFYKWSQVVNVTKQ